MANFGGKMKNFKQAFTLAEGATGVNEEITGKLPSLARLCRANNPVNCLREVFLFESYARVIEKGLRVGLFPARGKHTTTETIPSLFVTLAEPTSLRVVRDCVHGSEASRRGSQRWRAGETYAGGRGFRKAAFTLAEILITLAVIGVVAAMTLPTLIAKINEKADSNQKAVIEAKLIQGLNMLDLHGGMNDTYSSTAEFVEELGKYMKITAVCDGSTKAFTECLPYSAVNYDDNGEQKTMDVSELNSVDSLSLQAPFMTPAAIVLADGTPVILSYKKDCISDPDSVKTDNKQIHSCVAGIYDFNGSRKPNLYGGAGRNDLIAFNGARIAEGTLKIGGVKILSTAKVPTLLSDSDCEKYKTQYSEISDMCGGDSYTAALVECKSIGGNLPTSKQLADIASAIYGGVTIDEEGSNSNLPMLDSTQASKLGIQNGSCLWSNNGGGAPAWEGFGRCYWLNSTYWEQSSASFGRGNPYNTTPFICVAD